ncbi:MAG TPA: cell division protein FtsL [Polyangia bacterium]|jgi:cell division protein FtsL
MVTERISLPLEDVLALPPSSRRLPGVERRAVPVLLALLFGVMGACLAHVWVRMQQIQTGYALSQERRESQQLAQTHRRLRIEAAVLKHPARVERIARARLGMAAPEPDAIHTVRVARPGQVARPPRPEVPR